MKGLILYFCSWLLTMTSFAQVQTDNMYVYRNDGDFTVFPYAEVDSITFSNLDINGVKHAAVVVQEFWTCDSVYRIPLEVIDSIGFITPQTIINDDVFPLTESHIPYILRGDTFSFTMLSTTPKEMRPKKGNIVVSEAGCTVFENGIIGTVVSIKESEEGFVYQCEKATLDDVYDQIVFCENTETSSEQVRSVSASGSRAKGDLPRINVGSELWNFSFENEWENSGTTLKVEGTGRGYCRLLICKLADKKNPLFAKFCISNNVLSTMKLNANSQADISPDPYQIGRTIKGGRISFPNPLLRFIWLEPQVRLFSYFEESGNADLDFTAHLNRQDEVVLIYSDGEWKASQSANNQFGVDVASLKLNGQAEIGLMPEIKLSLNGSATGIGVTGRFGVKQTAELKFDAVDYFDTGTYEALKDSKTETYQTQSVSLFAESGLFSKETDRYSLKLRDADRLLMSSYLFPTFEENFQYENGSEHSVSITANRDLLLPVTLNMAVYDEQDNLIQRSHDNDPYDGKNSGFTYAFKDLPKEKKLKAYPLVKLGDIEVRATPAIDIDRCMAKIDEVKLIDALYVADGEQNTPANKFDVDVSAISDDMQDVREWGVYSSPNHLIPFKSLEDKQEIRLEGRLTDADIRFNYTNFVAETDMELGVYIKKYNAKTNQIQTLLGPLRTYTLRYDTKPSIVFSNPKIINTEVIGSETNYDDDGNPYTDYHYFTSFNYDTEVTGSFWIERVTKGISGGEWSLSNPSWLWHPSSDGIYEDGVITDYWTSTELLGFTYWCNLHLRNGAILKSNYLNLSGTETLTSIWVSSAPSFVKRIESKRMAGQRNKPAIVITPKMPTMLQKEDLHDAIPWK